MSVSEDNLLIDNDLEIIEENNENPEGNFDEPTEETEENESKKEVKPEKKVIRYPRVILKEEHLRGEKGLTVLPKHFQKVKYKGRGNEEQDLNVILKTYEHWCHRLFPKMPLDDCLARIEWLGKRKIVKTYIKKIRMNMVEDTENFNNSILSEEEPVFDNNDNNRNTEEHIEINEEMMERIRRNKERAERIRMDRLRQQEMENDLEMLQEIGENVLERENNSKNDLQLESSQSIVSEEKTFNSNQIIVSAEIHQENTSKEEINNDILERIRKNREKAEKIKMERLRQQEIELPEEIMFVSQRNDFKMDSIEIFNNENAEN